MIQKAASLFESKLALSFWWSNIAFLIGIKIKGLPKNNTSEMVEAPALAIIKWASEKISSILWKKLFTSELIPIIS